MLPTCTQNQPAAPLVCVDRVRLYHKLDCWPSLRALLIHAPAGYGKTTLVSRWLARAGNQINAAWVALDESAGDPALFVSRIAAALDMLVDGVYDAVQSILEDVHPDPQRALSRLLLDVADYASDRLRPGDGQLLLVLDDLHLVQAAPVIALLKRIIEHAPPNLHLFLISRTSAGLALARQYAHAQIAEIDVEELRFTAEEVRGYLELHGFAAISAFDLAQIQRQSAGWIIALQIVMLGQRSRGDIGGVINSLTSDSHWLASYLSEEVLAQQPAPIRQLLLYSSILDTFTPALCAAVSGLSDVQQVLQQINAANLLLIQRGNNEWGWYHHLFQEWLQRRLLADEGKLFVQTLHRRAATWYAQVDAIPSALRHLRAAGDDAAAADLVAERLPALILRDPYRGRLWLDLLPHTQVTADPRLMLLRCRLEGLFDNHELLTYVQEAEQTITASALAEPESTRYRAELLAWRTGAHFLRGDLAATAACLQQVRTAFTMLDSFTSGLCDFLSMHVCSYEGRHIEAAYYANQALATFTRENYPAAVIAIRRELARQALRLGHSREANHQVQVIISEQHDGPFVIRELLLTYLFATQNSYWQNDLAQARRYHQQAALLARRLQDDELLSMVAGFGALYAADSVTLAEPAQPHDVPVLIGTISVRIQLQIMLLARAGRVEEAWHLAESLDIDRYTDPATRTRGALIAFLYAYIARGAKLAAISPWLTLALNHQIRIGDRFGELWLLVLRAWQQLKLNRQRTAITALDHAVRLALEMGYTRVVLDIPDLLPLLDVEDTANIRLRTRPDTAPPDSAGRILTPQELAVLRLLDRDYPYEHIAHELVISINTVRTHARNIYTKLGVNRRAQALARARELGLL